MIPRVDEGNLGYRLRMARNVTDASFGSEVLDRSDVAPVVVEFWAAWCGPCSALEPILDQAVARVGLEMLRVNVDENPQTSANFGVKSIPFVVAIHHREVVKNFLGALGAEAVRQFVDSLPPAKPAVPSQGGFLPERTAPLFAAAQATLAAIASGRKALVATCAQRTKDDKEYELRLTQLAEDFAARIAAQAAFAFNLETQTQGRVGFMGEPWFKGIGSAQDDARSLARESTTRHALDETVTRTHKGVVGQVTGTGVTAATNAIGAANAAATKIIGTMSKAIHRRTFVEAMTVVNTVIASTRDRTEHLQAEKIDAVLALANERDITKARNDESVQAAARELERSTSACGDEYNRLLAASPVVAQAGWSAAEWQDWSPPSDVGPIYLGSLVAPKEEAQQEFADLPTNVVALTDDIRRLGGLLYTYRDATRPAALSAARSLVARLLAAIPPGKARFTFFDPLGLGEAVAPFLALADHDHDLIDGKVWSSADGLRSRLTEHMSHIEVVIQKYLRGEYETIEEYNKAAGEIAEPYRFLFVFDYPAQFDEGTVHQLSRIIENGPRCGLYTVVLANADTRPPHGSSIQTLPKLPNLAAGAPFSAFGQPPFTLSFDVDPIQSLGTDDGQAVIDRIVDLVGRAGRGADNVTVDLTKAHRLYGDVIRAGVRSDLPAQSLAASIDDPSTWWANTSVGAVAAPIGQSGARDVALLRFDSEILSGGLLVGRPGAGKSTLLHSYIGGLCSLYPPTELELYLIDFKEGVEFKAYAEAGLPHARCVAVESERDFGVSVLESLVAEMKRRAELIRSTGGEQTSFARLRASLDRPLPRIVLVFDEFHVLFSEDDRIGATAAAHLETIIRQGRGFGVHVLLGSQSLAGLDTLGRHVLQLLPIRLLLPSAESDAHLVLGDGNDAWRMLSRRGEGILNIAAGAVEANVPFQAAFEPEEDRLARLKQLRRKADAVGFVRRPVVFEGYGASDVTADSPSTFIGAFSERSPLTLPLRVGTPMSLAGPIDIELRREGGANVLVVARGSHGVPLGVTLIGLASAASSPGRPRIEFVDFTAVDEGVEDAVRPLEESRLLSLTRRRAAERAVAEIAAEVKRRIDEDDVRSPAVLLVLFGLHRARDLDPDGASDPFDSEPAGDLLSSVRQILVNGAEVGVHVLAWADSVASLARRLPRTLRREFGTVVAGPMSRDDSMELIDSDAASTLKSHQIAVYNDDAGTVQRGRSFGAPPAEWLVAVSSQLNQAGTGQ